MVAIMIVIVTMLFGTFRMITSSLPNWYVAITTFIVLKMVFKYNKCTMSYFECKLRGVRKEHGYIYRTLQALMDLPVYMIVMSVMFTLVLVVRYFQQT